MEQRGLSSAAPDAHARPGRTGDGAGASELAALETFISLLPGRWWVKDAAGKYLCANRAIGESLGVPREEMLGKTDFAFMPKATAESVRANDVKVLETGENLEVLEQLPQPDGGLRSWFSAKFLLPIGGERCTAGFAIEITRVARARLDAEVVLQQVLDAISDMVLVKGPSSHLEWANQAFLTNYGMTNEQLKGIIDAPFSEPDITQQYVKDDAYVFETGLGLEILEEPMLRHDGQVLTCHTVKSPIFDSQRKVIKMVAVIRDITERKRLELELRQAQKLESVGRLASGIAHEINTPIQFVRDQTSFLRSSMPALMKLCKKYQAFLAKSEQGSVASGDIAELRELEESCDLEYVLENVPNALDSIWEGTTRVAALVRAMQEFGHPDRGEKTEADINHALETTAMISGNEVKYVADLEMDLGVLPRVVCYPNELNQVFLNLLVNAAHAIGDVVAKTGQRGKIRVVSRHVGEQVIVSISDTGTGIPEAVRAKVFEPFFTTKEVGRGTGQGLAIARIIVVEKHQGTLTFDTELERGTTFHVKIPVGTPARAAAEASASAENTFA